MTLQRSMRKDFQSTIFRVRFSVGIQISIHPVSSRPTINRMPRYVGFVSSVFHCESDRVDRTPPLQTSNANTVYTYSTYNTVPRSVGRLYVSTEHTCHLNDDACTHFSLLKNTSSSRLLVIQPCGFHDSSFQHDHTRFISSHGICTDPASGSHVLRVYPVYFGLALLNHNATQFFTTPGLD